MLSITSKYHKSTTTSLTQSKSVPFLAVMWSTIVMNLQMLKRYKANLIGGILEIAIITIVFGIMANAVEFKTAGYASLTQSQIFIFFLGAIIIIVFQSTALSAPVEAVHRDLYNGTLEYLYFNPSSRLAYFAGSIVADGLIKFIAFFIPAFAMLAFFSAANINSLMFTLAASISVFITVMALGILIALSAILWKAVSGIIGIISLLFQFLSGAFFPIYTFPEPVQWLAYLLPYTWGYDLVRYYAFNEKWITILPVEVEWSILCLYAGIYLFLSILLLGKVEQHAKTKGLHLI